MLVPSRSDIEIAVKPGSLLRLHASAQGKLSLAFGPASLLESVMTQDLASITPHTITDHSRLKTEIETVRKRGWASAPHEAMIGINALAAPVFGALGHYAGAIAITDSVQFISHKPSDQQVHELRTAAMDISRRLGFRGVRPV